MMGIHDYRGIREYPSIWVNYNDLTVLPHWNHSKNENHPQMAELFRLVKYYNLPIYIYIYVFNIFSELMDASLR